MKTNKPCRHPGCNNQHLDFNVEATGRELTCSKCGAVYAYRAYMMADYKITAEQEKPMFKDAKCEVCGKGSEAGRIWGGLHKKCRKAKREVQGTAQRLLNSPVMQEHEHKWAIGPEGATIPIRLEITVSLKVETR
jgi:hypothetical protein